MKRRKKDTELLPALASWAKLNERIMQYGETALARLIKLERASKNRTLFLRRLHQRLTRVRAIDERRKLLK